MIIPQNIVLSGGSTMFKDFGRRLQQDLKMIVDRRIQTSETASGAHMRVSQPPILAPSNSSLTYFPS